MKRNEFIQLMESKGFAIKLQNNEFLLCKSMQTIEIYKDDRICYSSPAGNFKYKTFDDFIIGKCYKSSEYNIRD